MKNRLWRRCIKLSACKMMFRALPVVLLGTVLSGCGGGDGGGGDPDEGGPIIVGTGITERTLARNVLDVKASSGEKSSLPINDSGAFNAEVDGTGPWLSRIDLGNGEFLYGIGFAGSNGRVQQNVHSYSDVIVRNWYASNGRDISADFNSTAAITLPTAGQIDILTRRIVAIVALVMQDYNVAGADLLAGAVSSGVSTFILQNPVIINNSTVNIVINNDLSGNGIQTLATDDLDISTDLTAADTQNPTPPTEVRAIAASSTEVVIVWRPSSDNIGVAAYRVFRDGIDVGETAYPVFTDTVTAGSTQVYTIVAVDSAGNVSTASAEVTGIPSGAADTLAPPAPIVLSLLPALNSINVSWQQAEIDDVAGFRVLGAPADEALRLLATVTSTFMTDTDVESGTEYCYRVEAVDASNNISAPTELLCATTAGTVVTTEDSTPGDVPAVACTTELETTTINENTTLNLSCYLVNSDIRVNEPAQLTILPGVTLKFAAGRQLLVREGASLFAEGTAASPIVFTAQDPTPGFWDGVYYFLSNSNKNSIRHAVIEYGGSGAFNANLRLLQSRVDISDTTLRHSSKYGFSIDATSSLVVFSNVTSTSNETAGVIGSVPAAALDSSGVFTGNDNDVVEVTGNVSEDSTWSDIGVPWLADGVDVRAKWTLDAGVEVQFESGSEVIVREDGQLVSNGSAGNPVLLTAKEKTAGAWNGLYFFFATGAVSTLTHTTIEYGGAGPREANLSTVGGSRFSLDNVTLRNGSGSGFDIKINAVISKFDSVSSTRNMAPGAIAANLVGKIGTDVDLTGNTDDRLFLSTPQIDDSQIWPFTGVPIVHDGIDTREALTLSPGTTLVARADSEIIVRDGGSVRAEGTAAQNIVFTAEQPIKGYWQGIRYFFGNSVHNVLDYTVVEYGGLGATSGNIRSSCTPSAIPTVTISNTNLDNSGGFGLFVGDNCNVIVGDNVTYMGNTEGPTNATMP